MHRITGKAGGDSLIEMSPTESFNDDINGYHQHASSSTGSLQQGQSAIDKQQHSKDSVFFRDGECAGLILSCPTSLMIKMKAQQMPMNWLSTPSPAVSIAMHPEPDYFTAPFKEQV
ncbi:anoctamin-5 isoform X4 [Lates japonicus]|uniref:Anoctamin-5 isoform X4 n=1 Tax=Lates japonicus TaxID=270547 RepID=A0AAD3MHC5_LATJO|nr:anoctamin-5 isoform X4 [Lates japonicus]